MAKRTRRKITNPSTLYKMSLSHQGKRNGMSGKHHTATTRKKISEALRKYWQTIYIE
ncbi:MAG: hypothetical protein K5650_01675 [Bacteroidales bacterium]|jgi:hypothetical protein|nr:hypothetical protein [Bacteroidales bacterium]